MVQIDDSVRTADSRAGARVLTAATRVGRRDDGVRAMRFLLKVAFWLSIAVMLLPTSSEHASKQQVSAAEAMGAASAAVSDMRQFCARQPGACEVGSQAVTTFGQKAQSGAKMLYEFLTDKFGPESTGSIPPAAKPSQHTLTPNDLAPSWRGPAADGKKPA